MYKVFIVVTCCLLSMSCSVNNSRVNKDVTTDISNREKIDLTLEMKRVSGVRVSGLGPDATILVKGQKSFHGNDAPIFVVDGIQFNGSYADLYTFIVPRNIKSIEVLKGSDLAMWGAYAGNGVISIDMKDRIE